MESQKDELYIFLHSIELLQYYDAFRREGFERLESVIQRKALEVKDPNAPEKWRSAYQLFRDDINRELQGQDIPFSEMSKIHSKRWSELSDDKRNVYFQKSRRDKEEYVAKMAVYEQTPEFRQYNDYLEKFYQQESTVNRVGRPKGAKSSKGKGKGPDTSMPEDYDYDVSPHVGAAKPSMSLPSSSSPPPSASSHDDMPD
ncbi:hypothetical protein GGI15_002817 [Coemansia interrupta]|uniref:HMG box domain-containing protein n=1 Tax=Coemansia interrupta TaxID=1126814 RepID=A0A9W8HHQ8_9FUNG|nr:hypothetical protein GGI15_002817 [Coemansia interrupta]